MSKSRANTSGRYSRDPNRDRNYRRNYTVLKGVQYAAVIAIVIAVQYQPCVHSFTLFNHLFSHDNHTDSTGAADTARHPLDGHHRYDDGLATAGRPVGGGGVTTASTHRQPFRRQTRAAPTRASVPYPVAGRVVDQPVVYGFRLEGADSDQWFNMDTRNTILKANTEVDVRLYGAHLNDTSATLAVGFTTQLPPTTGPAACRPNAEHQFPVTASDSHVAVGVGIRLATDGTYFVCYTSVAGSANAEATFVYIPGSEHTYQLVKVEGPLIPLWLQALLLVLLLCMSGLFSGLNLGLMALDKNELKVIERCGTEQEKQYAKQITPVRKRGNYLLCTLLLGNVLVNSTLTILLDDLTSGIVAVVASTLSIVVFGEIIPQALCSRHGLAVGARTVYLTYLFMVLTFPLSYPISKVLDKVLGEEIGNVYDRERLMEYIRVTKDHNRLDADEVNIISGALKLSKMKVVEIMTQIQDVFMLSYNTVLNFEAMNTINSQGYSRVPVYEGDRNNVVGILHAKDLAFTDPDNNMPIKALIEFYKHPLYFVYEDVTLDVMLNEFKQGKSHMAFVRKIIDDGINDPVYELAGVVTLEDVIEELIQAEINDETDVISDNRRKQKRKEAVNRPNYSDFMKLGGGSGHETKQLTSQLALAAYRYLSTFVEPFTPEYLTEMVLKRLMSQKIYHEIKVKPNVQFETADKVPADKRLYTYGKVADYFILILDGKVRVIIGKEQHSYECGAFQIFGVSALKLASADDKVAKSNSVGRLSITEVTQQHHPSVTATQSMDVTTPPGSAAPLKPSASTTSTTSVGGVIGRASISDGPLLGTREGTAFIPDFTVYCMETTTFMKVPRNLYLTAYKASIMERQRRADGSFGAATGSLSGVDGEDDGIMFGTDSDVSPRLPPPPPGLNTTASAKQLSAGKPSPTGSTSASNRGHGGSGGAGVVDGLPPIPDDNIKSNSSNHGLNLKLSDNHSRKSSDSINSIQNTSNNKTNSNQNDEKSHLI